MPTENERKYVLALALPEKTISKAARTNYQIQQGYLMASKGMSLRLRSSMDKKGEQKYYLTYKSSTPANRVVEVEKKIDKRDFSDLWPQCMNKLTKVRYEVVANETWEVDFFKDHNDHTYFVMAEVELPEDVVKPSSIPALLSESLVHEVLLTDCRFASKLLGDVRYAKELYNSLCEGLRK